MGESKNRFASYQKQIQDNRERLVVQYLSFVKPKRIRFPHVSALADVVSTYIAAREESPCSRSTLLRNWRYKVHLLRYIAETNAGKDGRPIGAIQNNVAGVEEFGMVLAQNNLKRENERLKGHITALELEIASKGVTANDRSLTDDAVRSKLEMLEVKYALTCQALQVLLTGLRDFVAVDADTEQFLDRAKMRSNILVERRLAAPFFEWLRANDRLFPRD
ncbi:hypothetical protein PQR12_07620 [Paraburkholderia nemoris]|uniref:hypothetical protein n=1 Tax=Paraburkholderia nemoris TaxID=2793076 RepID=UPI0038BBBF6F